MALENIESVFDKFHEDGEYIEFDRVENKLSNRPDLHAFLLLDKLVPGKGDMVSGAEHDEIYLETDLEELAAVATEDDIRDLVRCGVRCDGDGLRMFA